MRLIKRFNGYRDFDAFMLKYDCKYVFGDENVDFLNRSLHDLFWTNDSAALIPRFDRVWLGHLGAYAYMFYTGIASPLVKNRLFLLDELPDRSVVTDLKSSCRYREGLIAEYGNTEEGMVEKFL